MSKTEFNTYDIRKLFESVYNGLTYDIVELNQYLGTQKQVKIQDFIKLSLYDYKLDIKFDNLFEESEAFNFPNLDNWLMSNGDTSRTYGLVELVSKNLTASIDIDMGSVNAKITFIINQDKVEPLENFISKLRTQYLGREIDYINKDNEKLAMYIELGDLTYESEPFSSPIGRTLIISLDLGISYISGADTYNDNEIMLSLDNEKYYKMPIINLSDAFVFTNKSNISQERPYRSGIINTNVIKTQTLSFWTNKNNYIATEILHKVRIMNADKIAKTEPNDYDTVSVSNTNDYDSNIIIYVSQKDRYYENGELQEQWLINTMVINSLKVVTKNSDFINATLTLTEFGKEV